MTPEDAPPDGTRLTLEISAAVAELHALFYKRARVTATTYINDNIVICVLEDILTRTEDALIANGADAEVIHARVAFQADTEDTAASQRLTHRRVVAFLSSNQTAPGIACELFFLDAPALAAAPEEAA